MDDRSRNQVPCGSCTLCCREDAIILHPEDGDNPADYHTERTINPLTGKPVIMLAKAENGDCVYLDRDSGCRIHGNAPAICRSFSCADMYRRIGAARLRRMVAAGTASQPVVDMGRRKLRQLEQEACRG